MHAERRYRTERVAKKILHPPQKCLREIGACRSAASAASPKKDRRFRASKVVKAASKIEVAVPGSTA